MAVRERTATKRPAPAKSLVEIRRMGYEGERQRQITNGWYCRGTVDKRTGEWTPEPGLPGDVLVLLPMGAPYEREMYPDKGFRALSVVPNKKAIAQRHPDFAILPPQMETLAEVMELLKAQRGVAKAQIQAKIDAIDEELADTGGLMKGEARQYRAGKRVLTKMLARLDDDAEFDARSIYRQMVAERQEVLKAQMSPVAVRHAEIEREFKGWDEELQQLEAEPEAEPA